MKTRTTTHTVATVSDAVRHFYIRVRHIKPEKITGLAGVGATALAASAAAAAAVAAAAGAAADAVPAAAFPVVRLGAKLVPAPTRPPDGGFVPARLTFSSL